MLPESQTVRFHFLASVAVQALVAFMFEGGRLVVAVSSAVAVIMVKPSAQDDCMGLSTRIEFDPASFRVAQGLEIALETDNAKI